MALQEALMIRAILVLSVLTAVSVTLGQPFSPAAAGTLHPGLTEARQREAVNYTGFIFDFDTASVSDQTPNGMLQSNQVASNPFLSTLPGDGNGQTLVTLGPCAGNTPHIHPRGSEISFLLYGEILFGMVEENSVNNSLVLRNMTQNQTVHIPQGLLHFSYNPTCKPAAFLASFATSDPGTQTMWGAMMRVPTEILHMATGIPQSTIEQLKSYPLVTAPGTGGEACLKKCGMDFASANRLTLLKNDTTANPGVAG